MYNLLMIVVYLLIFTVVISFFMETKTYKMKTTKMKNKNQYGINFYNYMGMNNIMVDWSTYSAYSKDDAVRLWKQEHINKKTEFISITKYKDDK